MKQGGQNCVFGELTTWRLEFREAKAPGSCRPELGRRGGMQKKSLKVLHRSSLVIGMLGGKERSASLTAHFPEPTERIVLNVHSRNSIEEPCGACL